MYLLTVHVLVGIVHVLVDIVHAIIDSACTC